MDKEKTDVLVDVLGALDEASARLHELLMEVTRERARITEVRNESVKRFPVAS